jgi:hypothetical protein
MRRKGKSIGFDAMVRFFMSKYDIPTNRELDKLNAKLDRLEATIAARGKAARPQGRKKEGSAAATDVVLQAMKRSKDGLKFADIQAKTGFPDKKIRNIIFRLNKLSKIKRNGRGVYVAT